MDCIVQIFTSDYNATNSLFLKFSNVVFSVNSHIRNDIDIQNIFKEFELDNHVVFIRYGDTIKNISKQ